MDAASRQRLSRERIATIRTVAAGTGADVALLTSRANLAWATAGGQHHVVTSSETGVGGLLVGPDRAWILTSDIERDRLAEEEVAGLDIEVVGYAWWEADGLERTIQRLLGAAAEGPCRDDTDLEATLVHQRSRLDSLDQERMVALGRVATAAVEDALAGIAPGESEEALAAALVGGLPGVRAPVVLVAADGRIERYRHPLPTPLAIRRRVMLVLVAEAWGIHVAVTRFRWWEPESSDLDARWLAVRSVQRAMTDASVPGATLGEVFAIAQDAYAAVGHPDAWREHHQGGTIAYRGRERVATPDDPTVIEAGMALAWNPSIRGVKVEDTIVVAADGTQRVATVSDADPADPGGDRHG